MSDGWVARAKCSGASTADFFPEEDDRGGSPKIYERARKEFCLAGCPVREECLRYAVEELHGRVDWSGLWSCTTPYQRKDIRQWMRRHGTTTTPEWALELYARSENPPRERRASRRASVVQISSSTQSGT